MILVDLATNGAITENVTLDDIEFGEIPKLGPGDYAVYNGDGSLCYQHRKIVERWVRYPYIFRVEQ